MTKMWMIRSYTLEKIINCFIKSMQYLMFFVNLNLPSGWQCWFPLCSGFMWQHCKHSSRSCFLRLCFVFSCHSVQVTAGQLLCTIERPTNWIIRVTVEIQGKQRELMSERQASLSSRFFFKATTNLKCLLRFSTIFGRLLIIPWLIVIHSCIWFF